MMVPHRFVLAAVTALALAAAAPSPGFAAGSIVDTPPRDSDYDQAVKLVKSEKYKDAIEKLQKVVLKEPGKADAWNYLGYSQRKTGKYDDSLKSYTRALDIDPKHKGANEYLGELYLMTDSLPKAEAQLKVLIDLCPSGCAERGDLEKAVAAYKKAKGITS